MIGDYREIKHAPVFEPNTASWRDDALCSEIGDDTLWYPGTGDAGAAGKARGICNNCAVMPECLEYALEHNEKWGIWGGSTPGERRKIIRKRESDAARREAA